MASIWSRRSNTGKLSLSMSGDPLTSKSLGPPSAPTKTRGGGDTSSHRHLNPLNSVSPLTSIPSPNPAASSAFGLGSGAFAAFSSSIKTPTKPPADSANTPSGNAATTPSTPFASGPMSSLSSTANSFSNALQGKKASEPQTHPLRYSWVLWYRSPSSKFQDYEKSTRKIASFSTVEEFWTIFSHLRRPNALPHVSEYHIFKKGIRPMWEDKENKDGGKWIIRLKKGVSTRYWEDLILAIIGDQFGEASEDLCGAVLSIRNNEDVLSVWTRVDGAPCLKVKHVMSRKLNLPHETVVSFKPHAQSIEAASNKEKGDK